VFQAFFVVCIGRACLFMMVLWVAIAWAMFATPCAAVRQTVELEFNKSSHAVSEPTPGDIAVRMSMCSRAAILVEGKVSEEDELRYRRATFTWYDLLTWYQGYHTECIVLLHAKFRWQQRCALCATSTPANIESLAKELRRLPASNMKIKHLLLVFTDHGGPEGTLKFEDGVSLSRGQTHNIIHNLNSLQSQPKLLVYINACYSGRVFTDQALTAARDEKHPIVQKQIAENKTQYVYQPKGQLAKLIHTAPDYMGQDSSDHLVGICRRQDNGDGTCRAFTAAVPLTTATSIKDPTHKLSVVDLFYVIVWRSIIRLSGHKTSTVGNHAVDILRMDRLNPTRMDATLKGEGKAEIFRFTPNLPWKMFSKAFFGDRPDRLKYKDVSTGLEVSLRRDVANLATPVSFGNMHVEPLDGWYPLKMSLMSEEICVTLFGIEAVLAWRAHDFDICKF